MSHAVSACGRFYTEGVRAAMLARIHNLAKGFSAVQIRVMRLPSASPDFQPWFDLSAHRDLVLTQLTRILESSGFVNSERMRQFLRFVVERALEGEIGHLKESVIGVEVFGRSPGYDPRIEPIVRIEARRLREKLQEYYEKQGSQDPVFIQLPKGRYV